MIMQYGIHLPNSLHSHAPGQLTLHDHCMSFWYKLEILTGLVMWAKQSLLLLLWSALPVVAQLTQAGLLWLMHMPLPQSFESTCNTCVVL